MRTRSANDWTSPSGDATLPSAGDSQGGGPTVAPQLYDPDLPIALSCGSCGEQLVISPADELVKCRACSSYTLVRREFHQASESFSPRPVQKAAYRFEQIDPLLKKGASYRASSLVSDGGQVILTETKVLFIAHQFNFARAYQLVIPMADIVRVWKSGLIQRLLNIETRDGKVARFLMWGRNEMVRQIESRIRP